jgi:hypothetical protein
VDFSDEHYIKLFTRDTPTTLMWPWQTVALWPNLLRRLDKAGVLDLGTRDTMRRLAVTVRLPVEVVEAGLPTLLDDGSVELIDGRLVAPKFLDAQESRKTDAAKARDYRGRKRDMARAKSTVLLDPAVTECHQPSPSATLSDPPALPVPCPSPARTYVRDEQPPVVVVEPETPPDAWTGEDFWQWAQWKRQEAHLVVERRHPDTRKLSSWYSSALGTLGGDIEALKEAFYRFGDDKHWQSATPPLPFAAFMSQWDRFVPRRGS